MTEHTVRISLHSRKRRRRQRNGSLKVQVRWVLSYSHPRTKKRVQRFFAAKADAEAERDKLLVNAAQGVPPPNRARVTIGAVVDAWLESKQAVVRTSSLATYKRKAKHIEPLRLLTVSELTTADVRRWAHDIAAQAGKHTAMRVASYLSSALALAAEDLGLRPPPMPTLRLGRDRPKPTVPALEDVQRLVAFAQRDAKGIYAALPLLTGLRPAEFLGLLWPEVDLDKDEIRVRRIQLTTGALLNATKTAAGRRDVPIPPMLRRMLLEWRVRCPRVKGELHRVLPAPQGGPLYYPVFFARVWKPLLIRAGCPHVRPYACRHLYISGLQAAGAEVALAAKLAGHANPSLTASVYSHALRGGADAVVALERIYANGGTVSKLESRS